MLPSARDNRVLEYKRDTNYIVTWLAATARSRGYVHQETQSDEEKGPGAPRSQRLKGKARKVAKQAAAAATATAGSVDGKHRKKYIISSRECISLAKFLSNCVKPPVAVPSSFVTVLDRVISARENYRTQLAASNIPLDARADDGHAQFVELLRQVRSILKPRFAKAVTTDVPTETPTRSRSGHANPFAFLEVYETSPPSSGVTTADPLQASPPGTVNEPNDTTEVEYEAEEDKSLEGACFAWGVFISTCNRISHSIHEGWMTYVAKQIDLAAVAVAISTGIDLVRHLEKETAPLFEPYGGHQTFHQIFSGAFYDGSMAPANPTTATQEEEDRFLHICRILYVVPYEALSRLQSILLTFPTANIPYGRHSTRQPSLDIFTFPENRALLDHLVDLARITRSSAALPVEDELMRAVRHMDRLSRPEARDQEKTGFPFWAAFACQVFLDTNLLGTTVPAEAAWMQIKSAVAPCIVTYMSIATDCLLQNVRAAEFRLHLEKLCKSIDFVFAGPFAEPTPEAKGWLDMNVMILDTVKLCDFFQKNPLYCGLVIYHLRALQDDVSHDIINKTQAVIPILHLYNTLRQWNALDSPCSVMEDLMTIIPPETIWVGGSPPTKPADIFRRFCLSIGMPVTTVMFNIRNSVPSLPKRGRGRIHKGASVSCLFKDRFVHNDQRVDWSLDDFRTAISSSKFDHHYVVESSGSPQPMERIISFEKGKQCPPAQIKTVPLSSAGSYPESPSSHLSHMVKHLAVAINAEQEEFGYDWIGIQYLCIQTMLAITEECGPAVRQAYEKRKGFGKLKSLQPRAECQLIITMLIEAGSIGSGKDLELLEMAAKVFKENMVAVGGRVPGRSMTGSGTQLKEVRWPRMRLEGQEEASSNTTANSVGNSAAKIEQALKGLHLK